MLCIAGFDGYFRKVNPAFRELLGYTDEELHSRPINEFVHPEDQDLTHRHRVNIWGGKPLRNFENRYVTKNGDVVWLSWNSVPQSNEKLVYAIAKNITHTKEHEKQRNQLIAELSKSNERLKQLNYATSHDIRSPISNLLAVFGMWDTSRIEDPEALEFIDMLRLTTEQLKRTMDRYVDGLRESETLKVDAREVDVEEVLDSVMNSLSFLIRDANAAFHIDLAGFRKVTFNYAYLESVFLNLMTNSIKYAHPDRNPVISVETRREGNWKRIVFSDNGLGFDSEKQKGRVFGLRQTFHDRSDSKGIGLYLVYNHVTSMGGRISVDSQINEGARFLIDFRADSTD